MNNADRSEIPRVSNHGFPGFVPGWVLLEIRKWAASRARQPHLRTVLSGPAGDGSSYRVKEGTIEIRILKIVLVIFVGLLALFFAAANIANWGPGLWAVAYVLGMEGHDYYTNRIFLPITNPVLVTTAYVVIIAGELLVGVLSLKGAWDLWCKRKGRADEFNSAKTFAILGCGMAVVVWFGGFMVFGGGLFQMWQSDVGAGSFRDAFTVAVTSGIIMLFLNNPDP